ncbi:MAG: hypothetical protein HYY06_19150 [Deltaproteobacteria bacterium]|nr:hypothetical protein [Deltaproteobacteria bacterium]
MTTKPRLWTYLLAAQLAACTATFGPGGPEEESGVGWGDGDGDPDADKYSLELDTSATDPFIEGFPPTAPVRGMARASEGLARVEVAQSAVPTDADGSFVTEVPVAAGLQLVPIQAFDADGHVRNGHRALLSARFLPEGEVNPGAAAITVTNEILAALAGDQLDEVANLDLSDEIMQQGAISQQGCDMQVLGANHGRPSLTLTVEAGQLVVTFVVPDLFVTFTGTCDMFLATVNFDGDMSTDVVVRTTLSAPPSETCLESFEHSYPAVTLPDFDLNIQSDDGGLMGLLVPLVGEIMTGSVSDQMAQQIAAQADGLIDEQARQLGQAGLGEGQTMTFNDVEMDVGFCLTGLESTGGVLRARLGLSVSGDGGLDAPGAPVVDGDLGPVAPSSLWLDASLISQMMFSLWRGGGLAGESTGDVTTGLLGLLVPELADMYPSDTPVTVGIDGLLPPLVRAADPGSEGDLVIEIGDLLIDLSVDSQLLFRMSALLKLTLDLQVQDGALTPVIVDSEATVTVLDEPIADVDDAFLQAAVAAQIGDQAQSLLGDGGFALPDMGGIALSVQDAVAEPGGRYVRMTLAQ